MFVLGKHGQSEFMAVYNKAIILKNITALKLVAEVFDSTHEYHWNSGTHLHD